MGVGTLFVCSKESRARIAVWKMYPGETGIEDATCRVRPPLKKDFLWWTRASLSSLGRVVLAVSSTMGAKVTKIV